MNKIEKIQEIERLKERVLQLEHEIESESRAHASWVPSGYYTTFHILAGMMLGFLGAAASLLFNVVGSVLVRQHPLELIKIFMTFPLGEKALQIDSGAVLALGACLYLGTGMIYGMIFHLVLSRFFPEHDFKFRFIVATLMGLGLWVINFYGILSWLQPVAFGGNWIVKMIPAWIAATTHLVFAWTMLLVDQWGAFDREGHLS